MTEDIYYKIDGTTLHLNSSGGSGWTKATTIGHLFGDWKSNHDITKVVINEPIHPTNGGCMFFDLTRLTSIEGLTNLDTSHVTDMSYMFAFCPSLTSLDLSGWNTSSVTNMEGMFNHCMFLTDLNLGGWDTGSLKSMKSTFLYCTSLESLDLSGWDTGNVTGMRHMFEGCPVLQSLDLTGWDTGNVTDMSCMFNSCRSLTDIEGLENLDTSNVTDMSLMFESCSRLRSLDLSGWDTGNVTDTYCMFAYCPSLKVVTTNDQRIISEVPARAKVVDPTARADREATPSLGDAIGQAASEALAADEGHTGHTSHDPR